MNKRPKRPRDTNQLAKFVVDLATGEAEEEKPQDEGKDPAAVALGRRGGQARAKNLSNRKRKEIAKKAANTRWKNINS